ncbi:unnamed protein product [Acanthoscelides obtectus]|uniref:Uncharacterized protein n=1 Tax=Acanthoscelides obtectus TaxID=200917 RepID=A0A9P0P3X3_ACAOB|nr:unnamed protein product [Acanthoscelides obtectus]CAK1628112.1 hypothetical protein AOBTE_LOCUS5037 [Acanthoscelides obtectus]
MSLAIVDNWLSIRVRVSVGVDLSVCKGAVVSEQAPHMEEVDPLREKISGLYLILAPPRRVLEDLPPLTLHGVKIPYASEAKYIGVIFDQRLTWNYYIIRTAQKAAIALGSATTERQCVPAVI